MIFYTTKKAILTYLLISSFVTIIFPYNIFAGEDVATFCFENHVSLSGVERELGFLLTNNDKIQQRADEHCLDIVSTETRIKLFEKFINKNYKIKSNGSATSLEMNSFCQLKLVETKKKKMNGSEFNLGNKNKLATSDSQMNERVESQIMLSSGKTGSLMIENKVLDVLCIKNNRGNFLLKFFYSDKNKASISSEVEVKSGETINVGAIKKELDNKINTVGIPQTTISSETGFENVDYELVVQ